MDLKALPVLLLCIAAIALAGCTTQPAAAPSGPASVPSPAASQLPGSGGMGTPVSLAPATPAAATASPSQSAECTREADCVPDSCCHPSRCIPSAGQVRVCNLMCTNTCEGPLDCGAGSCGCPAGKCTVIPAKNATGDSAGNTSLRIRASPERYSPVMSSTPGIGLEPEAAGFSPANATFVWNATYGRFLSWNAPSYVIEEKGDSAVNHGEKLYWSFTDRPASTDRPVIITVTAEEIPTGRVLGSSRVVLAWEGNLSVRVSPTG